MIENGLLRNNFETFQVYCKWYLLNDEFTIPQNNMAYGSLKISPYKKELCLILDYDDATLTFTANCEVFSNAIF